MQYALKNLLKGFSGATTANIVDDKGVQVAAFEKMSSYKKPGIRIMYVNPQAEAQFKAAASHLSFTTEELVEHLLKTAAVS